MKNSSYKYVFFIVFYFMFSHSLIPNDATEKPSTSNKESQTSEQTEALANGGKYENEKTLEFNRRLNELKSKLDGYQRRFNSLSGNIHALTNSLETTRNDLNALTNEIEEQYISILDLSNIELTKLIDSKIEKFFLSKKNEILAQEIKKSVEEVLLDYYTMYLNSEYY